MSSLWVLALGASIGYLAFKRQTIESRLDLAVAEFEGAGAKPSGSEGATFAEIKGAWKNTEDTRNRHFHERLPDSERATLLRAEDQRAQEVEQFEKGQVQGIEGLYLEQVVPS